VNPELGSTLCDTDVLMEYPLDLENEEVEQGEILSRRMEGHAWAQSHAGSQYQPCYSLQKN